MNAPAKPKKDIRHPALPRDEKMPDGAEMHERTMRRFPKIMARLAER
jgi:hypothetical protein